MSVLVLSEFRLEKQSLMREGLGGRSSRSSWVTLSALGQRIKLGRVRRVVIPVEVEVEDTASARYRSGAGGADGTLVGGVDVLVAVSIPEAGVLMDGEFTVGGVDVSFDDVAAQVGGTDDVPIGVLMNVEVALGRNPHHDEFVDVLRAVDELLDHRTRSVVDLADPLPVVEVYLGFVVKARLGHDLPDPPTQGVGVWFLVSSFQARPRFPKRPDWSFFPFFHANFDKNSP